MNNSTNRPNRRSGRYNSLNLKVLASEPHRPTLSYNQLARIKGKHIFVAKPPESPYVETPENMYEPSESKSDWVKKIPMPDDDEEDEGGDDEMEEGPSMEEV